MAMPKGQLEAKLKEEHDMINRGVLREENPLDLSDDFADFLEACRRGDLKQCQTLILAGVNINGKDQFDYTPLIVASLCGHYEVAQLLLESGALAERNTFQGERCLYNALNDRIRNLLLRYDYSKSSDPLQPWSSHITSLLTYDSPKTSDITLTTDGGLVSFQLHKFLLAARTPYFRRKLSEAPGMDVWRLPNHMPPAAFRIVLRYLYLDDVTGHAAALGGGVTADPDANGDDDATDDTTVFHAIVRISKHLEINQLWEAILASTDRRLARQRYQDEVERAQQQVSAFFRQHVLGNKMAVDKSRVGEVQWPHDNFIFADCLLQADEPEPDGEEEGEDNKEETQASSIPIGPVPTKPKRRTVLYPAHKALLVRCDYFQTMFRSAFREAQPSPHLRVIPVDCAPEVLEIVLSFLYTEQADIPLDLALEVLYVADMLFLDKLKTKAAVIISTLGSGSRNVLEDPTRAEDENKGADNPENSDPINIYDVLRAAWDLRVQRLEEFAARFFAQRLEHYIDEPAFADLVQESAQRLRSRQETDSIELIDDIRYFLSERFRLRFEEMALEDIEEEATAGEAKETGEATKVDIAEAAEAADAAEAAQPGEPDKTKEETVPEATKDESTPAIPNAGIMRTLDGNVVEDEFDSDALNYQILLLKIDQLLERLGLDG